MCKQDETSGLNYYLTSAWQSVFDLIFNIEKGLTEVHQAAPSSFVTSPRHPAWSAQEEIIEDYDIWYLQDIL